MMLTYDFLVARTYEFSVLLAQAYSSLHDELARAGAPRRVTIGRDIMRIPFGDTLAAIIAQRICSAINAPELPQRMTPLQWKHLTLTAVATLRRDQATLPGMPPARLEARAVTAQCIAVMRATSEPEPRWHP